MASSRRPGIRAKMPATQLAVLEYAATLSAWIWLRWPLKVGASPSMISARTYVAASVRTYVTIALVIADPIGGRYVPTKGMVTPKTEYPMTCEMGPIAASGMM